MGDLQRLRDLDVDFVYPDALARIVEQRLTNLEPWHIMGHDLASQRLAGLRSRFGPKYIPFARRQDNDDIACFDPARPMRVVVVHDFADAGTEERQVFAGFWEWFRAAIEDMIEFD